MQEFFKTLLYDYILLNVNQYDNIGLFFPIGMVLIALPIVLILTVIFVSLRNSMTARLFSQLLRHEATSEESAKTLRDLRLSDSFTVKSLLTGDARVRSVVALVGEKKQTYEEFMANAKKKLTKEKLDFSAAQFYVRPERVEYARTASDSERGSLLKTALICAAIFAIFFILFCTMPEILTFINGLLA